MYSLLYKPYHATVLNTIYSQLHTVIFTLYPENLTLFYKHHTLQTSRYTIYILCKNLYAAFYFFCNLKLILAPHLAYLLLKSEALPHGHPAVFL